MGLFYKNEKEQEADKLLKKYIKDIYISGSKGNEDKENEE